MSTETQTYEPGAPRPPAPPRPSPLLRPLWFTSILVGGGLVGIGVLAMVTTFATREDTEMLTVAEAVTSLRVELGSGDVTVHDGPAGSPTTVKVTTRAAFRTPDWGHTIENGALGLTGSCPGSWPIDTCAVDLDIVVPADVTVDLHTEAGDQRVSGLGGAVALRTGAGDIWVSGLDGDLDARTGSGDLRATALDARRAALRTGSGDINAEFTAVTTSVSARTGSGDVQADFVAAPAEVIAKTGSGDLEVLVPGDGTTYDVTGKTGSGDRQITVPTGSATHRIAADTGSGDVNVGLR